ncbi:MAG TPA: phosphoglycerate kinase [Bacillota bacterium]|nr:phosphoglycerate kinase [Bacillota bacterium]HOB86175.1 phosphoglycerate kinase [Bacillota bacterium]HOP68156.1 phosphoglycerate kinase [Bacillota bacterium]HPZ64713.1 phosphoglycerate kinase [Bacillota bacterium]HQD06367.1 phosphoglycerate kinase [Bacillota bacterium]
MAKVSIEQVEVAGKRVLVRADLNVPLADGVVQDDTRIRGVLPTIKNLLERGACVILVSHLGRPKGKVVPELRLDPVAEHLSKLLGRPVRKLDQVVGEEVEKAVAESKAGEVLLLENVRFEPGEEKNDPELAARLARLADLFVNDAFGTAHRAHASTAGVAKHIPAVAGLLMIKEIEALTRCLEQPGRPLVAILGGAKVSDKIGVLRRFMQLADTLLVGGGMANTLLAAKGYDLGDSFYEAESLDLAKTLLEESGQSRCRLELPVDLLIAQELKPNASYQVVSPEAVPAGWKAVDIGPETVKEYSKAVAAAGMVVWNGPLGVFEVPPFHQGTEGVARAVAESRAYSVVGGGDVVAALEKLGLADKISFISTGGGATLEFWEGKELPGIAVLQEKTS